MRPITKIYIVTDDAATRRLLRVTLERNGFTAVEPMDVERVMTCILLDRPDLVILNLDTRTETGLQTLAGIRAKAETPVIVVSSDNNTSSKVAALDLGADDYIVSPFDTRELLARINASLRNQITKKAASAELKIGEIHINLARRRVHRNGVKLDLSFMEYRCLAELARRPTRTVTHLQLIRAVWGSHRPTNIDYLRALVSRLRKKIGNDGAVQINAVPGIGYQLKEKTSTRDQP